MAGTPETPIPAPVSNFSNTKSMEFDGADAEGIGVLSGIALPGPTGCSYSCWVYSTNFAYNSGMRILTITQSRGVPAATNPYIYELMLSGATSQLVVYEGGLVGTAVLDPTALTTSVWNHICVTSTSTTLVGGDIKLYVNGINVASGVGSGVALPPIADIYGGYGTITAYVSPSFSGTGTPSDYFYGQIDEVAIWNSPLSAAQITTLYNNRKASNANDINASSTSLQWSISTIASPADTTWVGYPWSDSSAIGNTIFVAYSTGYTQSGSNLKFAKSINGGTSWTISTIDSNAYAGFYVSISAIDDNTIFISYTVGDPSGTNEIALAKSTNGGSNWTVTSVVSDDQIGLVSLSAVDSNTIFISYWTQTWPNGVRFAKSTDGGASFTILNTLFSYPGDLYAIDANNIFIAGKRYFIKSTDGGATWSSSAEYNPGVSVPDHGPSIWAADANTIYFFYGSTPPGGGRTRPTLSKSTDGGSSWTVSYPLSADPPILYLSSPIGAWVSMTGLDANNIALIFSREVDPFTSNDDVGLWSLISDDGGSSWTLDLIDSIDVQISNPHGKNVSINAISSNLYYAVYGGWTDGTSQSIVIRCASSSPGSALKIWWRMGDFPDDTAPESYPASSGYIYNNAPVPSLSDNILEVKRIRS